MSLRRRGIGGPRTSGTGASSAVALREAPEELEDEMLNAGLLSVLVVDDHKADFWKKVFRKITVHEAMAVRTGGEKLPAEAWPRSARAPSSPSRPTTPGCIAQLRKEAARRGLDPNVWFHNVEYVAAEKIGAETVTYVSNIFKYYVAYRLIAETSQERRQAIESLKAGSK